MKTIQITPPLSKNKEKHKYKLFWKKHWKMRSVSAWDAICIWQSPAGYHSSAIRLLCQAAKKLSLEKNITEEECNNIICMLQSPDHESRYMGISILASRKPKMFINETTKNSTM